jgi:cytosine/adenosine deaminase-related metal-dependent hydrolase
VSSLTLWRARTISFVNAAVIGPDGQVLGSLRIRGSRIESLGARPDRRDLIVDLNGAIVVPGLINAHDHLDLNSFGRLKWRDRYCNVRDWIADFQPRFATDPALAGATRATLDDRLWAGAFKNLLAGVTTVCHHNPWHDGFTRRFPVRVVRNFRFSHSLGIDGDRVADVHRRTPPDWPWIVHAAEGIDRSAAAEIETLTRLGCITPNAVLVHGVALTACAARQVIGSGASLVWCPTSNQFLFGTTADVRPFDRVKRLAIGTDSRLSGEGDLLDEIRAAHATGQVTAGGVLNAVTTGGADVLRLSGFGALTPGAPADICVIHRLAAEPVESFVAARRADVKLTMVAGQPLLTDFDLAPLFGSARASTAVRVDGAPKLLARAIARRAATVVFREPGLEVPVN